MKQHRHTHSSCDFCCLLIVMFITAFCIAQSPLPQVEYYYAEEQTTNDLQPNSLIRNADHSLTLSFSDSNLQTFFDENGVLV